MSEQNKAVVRRLFEDVWTNGKLPVIDEIIDRSYVNHDPANPEARGPEGYKQLVNKYRTAFPDFRFTIDDLLAEGEKVTARFTARGTHKGSLEGIAPTGAVYLSRQAYDQIEGKLPLNFQSLGPQTLKNIRA